MEPQLVHRPSFTVIGFSQNFRCAEGYEKCPQFWDEGYAKRFARLFATMKPETPEERAVFDNRIGEFAVCWALPEESFEYMICGEYRGGTVPEDMCLRTLPESDWLEFTCRGPLPQSIQELNTFVHRKWMPEHAAEYRCRGIDMEFYSKGNPQSADYECGIRIPVICKKAAPNR